MIVTNEIRAEFDAWFDGGNYAWGDHSSTAISLAFAAWQASRESLIAEIEALRKDAERYRRMRAATLKQIDDTPDQFDIDFDCQLEAVMSLQAQS